MNTIEQKYIEGFVKRANQAGFNNDQAVELLKSALVMPWVGPTFGNPQSPEEAALSMAEVGGLLGTGLGGIEGALSGHKGESAKEKIKRILSRAAIGGTVSGLGSGLATYSANELNDLIGDKPYHEYRPY